jgi:PilZ domain
MKISKKRFLPDRRLSQRHNVKMALRVRLWKSSTPEHRAESVNLSQRGMLFATDELFQKGDAIEILLKMPEEITGEPTTEWRCTGLVVRVEPVDSPKGKLAVGVRFDCYEVSRLSVVPELAPSVSGR